MMENNSAFNSLVFTTSRLEVFKVDSSVFSSLKSDLLTSIPSLLTPTVVQSLPPYFHNITTQDDADSWLAKMMFESHLFAVCLKDSMSIIGFIFIYEADDSTANLGYLLGKAFWHQGYGSELLIGLLETCQNQKIVKKLIAGVETDNLASNKLLQKVGFVAKEEGENGVLFYEYRVF